MKNIKAVGAGLIILGIVFMGGYGVYIFMVSDEIPYFVRVGMLAMAIGIVIVLLALVRERITEGKA